MDGFIVHYGGAKCRFIHFGFAVSSITFHPKMPKITQSDENIAKLFLKIKMKSSLEVAFSSNFSIYSFLH